MNNAALKAWIDAMPIDDVRRRIARLEAKLSDLRVLEQASSERHETHDATAQQAPGDEASPPHEWGEQPT